MSLDSEFNAAAAMLVKAHGGPAVYTQDADSQSIQALIDLNFEVIDDESGAGQVVKAVMIAKADFPFSTYKVGDTIQQNSTTHTVQRKLADDNALLTLELR